MQKIANFIDSYGNPLEWDTATRAMLLLGLCLLVHTQYLLWAAYQVSPLAPVVNHAFVDSRYIKSMLPYFSLLWLFTCGLFIFVMARRRAYPNRGIYEHLATQYYGITLSFCSFLIGNMSVATGVVLAGAPVVGFILFNPRAVLLAFAVSLISQGIISYGCANDLFLYAPIMSEASRQSPIMSGFWITHLYLFSAPHLIALSLVAYHALRLWRKREDEIRMLSLTDPLTQLSNRRSILVELGKALARAKRQSDGMLSVILIDLDHFKQINDTYGHGAGDAVLKVVSSTLKANIREGDHVGRYGGEEFLIVLPDTNAKQAKQLAERCREAIATRKVIIDCKQTLNVTASMGLESLTEQSGISSEALLHNADLALYAAKDKGRNQVVLYSPSLGN